MPPITPLARLEQIGFRHAGVWSRDTECIRCQLVEHGTATNVLYAFVVEDEVVYVGKTIRPLRARMRNYERPGPTQSTNIRSNAKIKDLLDAGGSVSIFALPDNGLLRYGGFHVNLAAGLEDSIVRELQPPWNLTGHSGARANEAITRVVS